jgi:hypothetical protein
LFSIKPKINIASAFAFGPYSYAHAQAQYVIHDSESVNLLSKILRATLYDVHLIIKIVAAATTPITSISLITGHCFAHKVQCCTWKREIDSFRPHLDNRSTPPLWRSPSAIQYDQRHYTHSDCLFFTFLFFFSFFFFFFFSCPFQIIRARIVASSQPLMNRYCSADLRGRSDETRETANGAKRGSFVDSALPCRTYKCASFNRECMLRRIYNAEPTYDGHSSSAFTREQKLTPVPRYMSRRIDNSLQLPSPPRPRRRFTCKCTFVFFFLLAGTRV